MYKEAIKDAIFIHELPSKWSPEVLKEANLVSNKIENTKDRKDLTNLAFVTIDGEDAKDFDDAIFCKENKKGFTLFVAIADVSFYVKTGSKLDNEAKKRGTSIYFPSSVIPMLPEKLSNNICSLKPNEDRYAMVCEMSIDPRGKKNKYKFYRAIINSKSRFTYEEIEAHIKKSKILKPSPAINSIEILTKLTKRRLKIRKKRKALELNPKEAILELNQKKEISKIIIKKTLMAHKLVEESMLLANESAAKYILERNDFGVFRIHENPDPSKLDLLKRHFKVPFKTANKLTPLGVINFCLNKAHETQDDSGQVLVLQTLARAEYSEKNIGHFGLQLNQYTHFTSPIRRYPDLLVHRIINNSLVSKKIKMNQGFLKDKCEESSMLERRAEKASRQVEQVLICLHLKKKIGSTLSGVIVGVTDFGLFVSLESYFISGLLHVSDLSKDRYEYLKNTNAIKGKKTGKIYRLGQKIKVKIAAIIPLERKITLLVAHGK